VTIQLPRLKSETRSMAQPCFMSAVEKQTHMIDKIGPASRTVPLPVREALRAFGLAVLVSFLSAAGLAQAPAVADTYVASSAPTTNNSTGSLLAVQSGVTSYIGFSLAGMPTGAVVNRATLRLFVDGVTTPGSFDVYQVNGGWTETGLVWNNAPVLGASATGGKPLAVTTASNHNFLVIDITQLVQNWINGSVPNYGIALVLTTPAGSFSFDSKENRNYSHPPELDVFFNGAQGPQGLTGPTGATGAQGPQGVPGPQGPAGTGSGSFNFRAAFDNTATYAVNDVATYSGSSYIAIAGNQGPNNPTPNTNPTAWSVMAQQGATGAAGPAGPQGSTGPTGAQGPQGAQGAAGTTGAPGPAGPQGVSGPTGPQGPAGPSIAGLSSDGNNGITVVGSIKTGSGPTSVGVTLQTGTSCPVPTGADAALCVGSDMKLHCTLSAAKGGGSC
jgi:hypothetical protein